MNKEQLEEIKKEMGSVAASFLANAMKELRQELKADQQTSLREIKTGLGDTVKKLAEKVSEIEKTLSGTAFVNKVLEDSSLQICTSLLTNTVTTTTTSIASTSVHMPVPVVPTTASANAVRTISATERNTGCIASVSIGSCSNANVLPANYRNPQSTMIGVDFPRLSTAHAPPVSNPHPPTSFDFSPISSVAQPYPPGAYRCNAPAPQQPYYIPPSVADLPLSGNLICHLAPFDGTVSWSDYRIQFEIVARNNRWTDQEKADAMATQLRGNALSVLSVFPQGHRIRYEELLSLLDQRFGMDSYSSQVQFYGRTQGPKESFANFALELQRLATSAFPSCPGDVTDRMTALRFLEGLRDEDLKTLVKVRGPKSLHEAVNAAQELATSIHTGRGRIYFSQPAPPSSSHGRRRRPVRDRVSTTEEGPTITTDLLTSTGANRPTLYNSFVPEGHASSSCPTPITSTNPGNPSTSTLGGMGR